MGNEDDDYRRKNDQTWRESVQSRIVSLTDSEVTQNDRLDEIDGEIHELKEMLEGKTSDRDDNGMKGDIHQLATGLNELHRLMAPDHLGQGGIIARLRALERQTGIEEKTIENRWKFLTAFIVAVISAAALVLTNLDRIEPPVKRFLGIRIAESSKQRSSGAKTSKRHRRPPPQELTQPEATDGTSQDDVP